jgi:RNA repair, ligase-Pnkp-associating, region of Hen1
VLLTITTTRPPATELGYLLHKHPDRPQSFDVSAGQAHVFYPEATPERCTAALLLDIDPITLVRGHKDGELAQYVNDRPYAAGSMLAVAIKEAFRTALTGRCDARPDLAAAAIPLEIRVPALRCRGGKTGTTLADRVFAPLGWSVETQTKPYTPPEWGDSPYLDLRLTGELRLADALNHLYVLLPVLDDATDHPRAQPGRAGRRDRLGQVDVRPRAFQADRGDLLGLLPRPGRRRRERPVGHAGRVRGAAPHRRPAPHGRPPHRNRRHQHPARSPP